MQVTGNFTDFYNLTMLPGLRAVVDRGYKKRAPMYPQIFNVNPSSKSLEQFTQVSGVGRFLAIGEAAPIKRDQPVQGFRSSFVHSRFGLSVPTSQDVIEDDNWNLINTMHSDLGWSCSETRELDAASTLNNAFSGSFLGPDAVALCSASHPLYKVGGVQSNLMASADLDVGSLQLALTAYMLQKRPSGEFIHAGTPRLVFHPHNQFTAYSITKSKDDPTTANRSINPLGGAEDGIPDPLSYLYLTAPNAWFLIAQPEDTGLIWFDRKKPYTKSWVDDETEVGVVGMRYKKSHGWNNYIGVLGNQGS